MTRALSILLLATSALPVAAQSNAKSQTTGSGSSVLNTPATLIISGSVSVNSQALTQSMNTVFKGDRIQTAASGVARVSAPGLALYLPANSCLTYNGQQLEMCNCGSLDVNSTKPVSITYRDRELVVSSESNAAFTMSVADRDLHLVNRMGAMEIAKSGTTLSRVAAAGPRSFAGLGCVAAAAVPLRSLGTSGVAAAAAAPAAISAAVIKSSSQRPPLSSTTP